MKREINVKKNRTKGVNSSVRKIWGVGWEETCGLTSLLLRRTLHGDVMT